MAFNVAIENSTARDSSPLKMTWSFGQGCPFNSLSLKYSKFAGIYFRVDWNLFSLLQSENTCTYTKYISFFFLIILANFFLNLPSIMPSVTLVLFFKNAKDLFTVFC